MRKESAFYIDLGTTNTLIHSKSKGFTIGEPTLLAEKKRSSHKSECIAFGFAARSMLGKTPSSSFVLRPLQEGVISDFRSAASLLHLLKKRVQDHALWLQPRILISLPYLVNHHERAAVREVSHDLGARRTHLISEPLLAALGSGLNVLGPRGSMIVDIGGGTSEAAIVSLGGIVVANAVRMGGHSLDSSIIQHIKNRYHFLIGEQTSEKVKLSVAEASPELNLSKEFIEVGGIDLTVGLPRKLKVNSQMIAPPVEHFISEILKIIKKSFEECPPELASDIAENGIVLAGGGSLLRGLSNRITKEIGVPTRLCKNPLLSVAKGGVEALNDKSLLEKLEAG